MIETIRKSAILIAPSMQSADGNAEGTPQIILWAQAIGLPVIVSRTGSLTEIVEDGLTGLVVEPDAPDLLAEAVLRLVSDAAATSIMTERASVIVRRRHRLEQIASQWRDIYRLASQKSEIEIDTGDHTDALLSDPLIWDAMKVAFFKLGIDRSCITHFRQGGQGVLFIVRRHREAPFLLKVPSYAGRPAAEHRIVRHSIVKEAAILHAVGKLHAGLLPYFIDSDPDGHFLAREFIEGDTLHDLLQADLSLQIRRDLLGSLLRTAVILFKAFHGNATGAYVIRDLKPLNLIVPRRAGALLKLIDIGSARPETDMLKRMPNEPRLGSGKWRYWSFEQLANIQLTLDRRTDYFSLGVTSFFILTGTMPYSNREKDLNRALDVFIAEYERACQSLADIKKRLQVSTGVIEMIVTSLHPLAERRTHAIDQLRSLTAADLLSLA